MEKINIAEILKDCPSGVEFDCTMYNKVTLINVDGRKDIIFPIKVFREDGNTIALTKYGQYTDADFAKCIIFPKGKTTWEGFHRPFVDGDTLTNEKGSIFIYKGPMCYNKMLSDFYCGYRKADGAFVPKLFKDRHFGDVSECRFATEKEKQQLFDAIVENGYKWNPETKTLEDLLKPKFKVGDEIVKRNSINNSWIVSSVSSEYYGLKLPNGNDGIGVLPVSEQDDWELMPVVPKFKVGDKIKYKDSELYCTLGEYSKDISAYRTNIGLSLTYKDLEQWELAPNKFDITSLKPFDKVLVRQCDIECWKPALWGRRTVNKNFPFITSFGATSQAIPFKNNEWLVGTTEDCDNYYKTWL